MATVKKALTPLNIGDVSIVSTQTVKEKKEGGILVIFSVSSDREASLNVKNLARSAVSGGAATQEETLASLQH